MRSRTSMMSEGPGVDPTPRVRHTPLCVGRDGRAAKLSLRGGRRLETRRRAPKSPRRGLLDRWTKGSRAVPGSAAEADREKAEANEEETLHRIYLVILRVIKDGGDSKKGGAMIFWAEGGTDAKVHIVFWHSDGAERPAERRSRADEKAEMSGVAALERAQDAMARDAAGDAARARRA